VNKQHISIIIPAYNEERYLGRCLDAIAAQIEKPYEVVVIDNGSADKTAEVAGQYSFVTVLSEPKKGRVFARNKGFMGATGELLARIDADAILPADWTQQVASYYTSPTALKTAWTSGPHFYNVRFPRTVSRIYSMLVFGANRFFAGHPTLWGSNMVLPKEIWRKVSDQVCLRNDIHEDLDLAIHVHRAGYQIVHKKQPTVRVQLRRVQAHALLGGAPRHAKLARDRPQRVEHLRRRGLGSAARHRTASLSLVARRTVLPAVLASFTSH